MQIKFYAPNAIKQAIVIKISTMNEYKNLNKILANSIYKHIFKITMIKWYLFQECKHSLLPNNIMFYQINSSSGKNYMIIPKDTKKSIWTKANSHT